MKKLLIGMLILATLLAGAAVGLAGYVRPTDQRDLSYGPITVGDKVADMLKRRQASLVLSEQDLNNLLKMKLASEPVENPNIRLTGADFRLQDGMLYATMNLLWKNRVPFEAAAEYRLRWTGSELYAEPLGAKVKNISIPEAIAQLPSPRVTLQDYLPAPVSVKNVRFEGTELIMELGLR